MTAESRDVFFFITISLWSHESVVQVKSLHSCQHFIYLSHLPTFTAPPTTITTTFSSRYMLRHNLLILWSCHRVIISIRLLVGRKLTRNEGRRIFWRPENAVTPARTCMKRERKLYIIIRRQEKYRPMLGLRLQVEDIFIKVKVSVCHLHQHPGNADHWSTDCQLSKHLFFKCGHECPVYDSHIAQHCGQ